MRISSINQHYSSVTRSAVKLLTLLFCSSISLSFPLVAQEEPDLSYLVFEPVSIAVTLTEGEVAEFEELTSLPTGNNPVTPSYYITTQLLRADAQKALISDSDIAQYEKSIHNLELDGGAYESALSQEMLALASLYQSQGDHETALEYLERAQHINRVNKGLFNLDQEFIIEEKIESHIALGNLMAADSEQEYLFYLKRKAYGEDSPDLLPAMTRYAEWNIFAFDSKLSQDPNLFYAGDASAFAANSVNNSIGEENFRTMRLMYAQNIYRSIIQILLNNYGVTDPRLMDMEKRLALTNYFFATNLDINSSAFNNSNNTQLAMASTQGFYDMSRVSSNSMGYRHGRDAFERRLEYLKMREDATPEELALARVELGDWLLLFKKRVTALEVYEEAHNELLASVPDSALLKSLFMPDIPKTIPDFIDYRYTRAFHNIPEDVSLDYRGWFDLDIEINRFGQTTGVTLINKSNDSDEQVEAILLRQLRNSTSFRPRFKDGELVDKEVVMLRYYYSM